MSQIQPYKGYTPYVFDEDDGLFSGKIAGISDLILFEADSESGLTEAFKEAVDDYLDTCKEMGKEPQIPA